MRSVIPNNIKLLRKLVSINYLRIRVRYRRNPYTTIFYSSFITASIVPFFLLVSTLFAMATGYFFVYMALFVGFGFISSMLIIPLLSVSFIFAVGVVLFGFVSNVTFKSGQYIYFKTDKRLKTYLQLMWANIQKPEPVVVDIDNAPFNEGPNATLSTAPQPQTRETAPNLIPITTTAS
mgnify:CR=1